MARQKRTSNSLEKAERRIAGMMAIKEDLDFGYGLSFDAYKALANEVREKQQQYNSLLSEVDGIYNELLMAEKELQEMSDHMLSSIKGRFGRDSSQYEKAGGVRRSERKRTKTRKTAEPAEPSTSLEMSASDN